MTSQTPSQAPSDELASAIAQCARKQGGFTPEWHDLSPQMREAWLRGSRQFVRHLESLGYAIVPLKP
jgi:hypothetical protein